jgi:putative aldouronate transport system substrate-binding protein
MGTCDQGKHQENIILAAFGVDTANGVSGMPSVMDINGKHVFELDNPDYKAAYQWMNKMYREGLIDMEVTTQTMDRFEEKFENGSIAMIAGNACQGVWDPWKVLKSKDDIPAIGYMYPYALPSVPGKTAQAVSFVNPYPTQEMFISKDTKHLNAVVNYIEWAHENVSYRQQEVSEGPVGILWNWTDNKHQMWTFTDDYAKYRNSADQDMSAQASPQLWETGSYSKDWYPWFNNYQAGQPEIARSSSTFSKYIANNIKDYRLIRNEDTVQAPQDSVIADNLPTLNDVIDEYTAKMIMAKDDADFETQYADYMSALESRAKWTEMKANWETLYAAMNK